LFDDGCIGILLFSVVDLHVLKTLIIILIFVDDVKKIVICIKYGAEI